jgi:subtilisin-like proprotein convertase family protein
MKKITLLIALLVCSVGFGQSTVSSLGGDDNPVYVQQRTSNQNISIENNSNSDIVSNAPGAIRVVIPRQQDQTLLKNTENTSSYLTGVFNYSDYMANGNVPNTRAVSSNRRTVVVNSNRNSGVIDTYTDLATFNANVAGGLTSEDFGGGLPGGGISACGPIINSTGDGTCFLAGEIVDGFDLTASNGTDVVYIGAGAIGNVSTLVGANSFPEITIITFTGDPVFEVAHDIWNNSDVDTDYRVYNPGGGLIQSFNLNNTVQTENFFGIISPVEIGHIEIEGLNASGELFGNFLFTAPGGGGGGCGTTLANYTNTDAGGGPTSQDFEAGNDAFDNQAADDFVVPGAGDAFICQIDILGTGAGLPVDPASEVVMYIYDDAAGLPGTLLYTESFPGPATDPGGTGSFTISPTAAPDLTGGVTYWLSIQAQMDFGVGGQWFWNQSADGNGNPWAWQNPLDGFGTGCVVWTDGNVCLAIPGPDLAMDISFQEAGGGGGGGPCTEENPNDFTFENGLNCSSNSAFQTANDLTVAADEDFTLDQITASIFANGGITLVDVLYYDDAAGLPGAVIGSEAGIVPSSQAVIGSNFGFDVNEIVVDVTPFIFGGQAGVPTTYWVELSVTDGGATGSVFWVVTSSTAIGNASAIFNAGWGIFDPLLDGVYIWSGNCGPIGGGGACTSVTYDATGLPLDIDPGGTSTADCVGAPNLYPVDVTGVGTIGTGSNIDNVTINITHTWDGDLDISLVSPAGTELLLSGGNGGSGDNYTNTVFMDGGADITAGSPPFTGTFEPEGGTFAAAFDTEAITGIWNLKICDNAGGDTGTVDTFSITICSPPIPDNDLCVDAIPIACGDVVVSDTLTNTDTGGNPAPDEWYSFTGSGTPQVVTLSLCDGGTDYDSYLRVFDACGGNQIAFNDDFCGLQSQLSFASDGTSTYYIMVEGFASNAGNFSLEVTCVDPPVNDECTGALAMNCGDTVVGETITATFDAGAPICTTNISAPGVWYVFTDTTGLVTDYTLSLCDGGTDYDSKLTVYTGNCGALVCVTDNDDTCGLNAEVQWQGDGLSTYYILVHGFGSSVGNFSLALSCAPVPPPNDMIVNSIDVDEIGFPYTDPAVAMPAATTENGTPAGCDNAGAKGVWYNFVPEGDGFATAEIITPGGASTLFSVNNGPLAGDYVAVPGDFGGAIPNTPLTEDTALVLDNDTTGDPNDACDPILNGASLAGKIAVIRRGSCEFGFKALSAQNEGAIAVIVVNNVPGDPIVMGGGADGDAVTIPVVMVFDVDGEPIISELEGGGTVNVSISSNPAGFSHVSFYTAPDENAIETDLTLVDFNGNQCVPGTSAIIPTTAGQAYYVYVANGAITDIVIDGENLGADDNAIQGFTYYPNPTDGILNLNSIENIDDVAIYNLLGQQVLNQTIRATSVELNVSTLTVGAYIMKVSVNGQIGTYKIIKR